MLKLRKNVEKDSISTKSLLQLTINFFFNKTKLTYKKLRNVALLVQNVVSMKASY